MLDPMVNHKGRLPKPHTGRNSRKGCLFPLYPTLFYPRFEPLRHLSAIVAIDSAAEGISLAAHLRHPASRPIAISDHQARHAPLRSLSWPAALSTFLMNFKNSYSHWPIGQEYTNR